MFDSPHRRFNPLTRDWVLVSAHRASRPWLGQIEKTPVEQLPAYDPTCYLCPGNTRAGGAQNPNYTSTYAFDNDFPAILPISNPSPTLPLTLLPLRGLRRAGGADRASPQPTSIPSVPSSPNPQPLTPNSLFLADPLPGLCRVICFSPRHDLTLPELSLPEVEAVVRTWANQTGELNSLGFIRYAQIFENKGAAMGCSNPHPHNQIWASSELPNEPAKELATQADYFREHGRPLLLDYIAEEQKRDERLVAANDHFTALVPFWAVWPFETLVVAHRPVSSLPGLTDAEIIALADILKRLTTRYDNLFETSFPYSMGFHQAPFDRQPHPEWILHAHFYPPLLRSATVKKFMVGYELLAMPQRDLTPETAAERLRGMSERHYKETAVRNS